MEQLFKSLNTKLDTYGAEICSCAVLENLTVGDLEEALVRVRRFESDLERIIEENK